MKGRDLTSGSLHRAIWYLAPPMMLETGIMNVAQLLDTYWVGQLGSAALAAVTISITIRWVLNSLANGLGIGGMAVVARRIGEKDENRNIPGFVIPSPYFDLAVGRDGLLRVVNPGIHRIEAYTFEGDLEFSWGEFSSGVKGFCGCCNPVNFAILPGPDFSGADDHFVTCEKGLTRVKIYDPEGSFIGVVAGPEQLVEGGKVEICDTPAECQIGGFDVAVDASGRVLILDTIKNVVRIFSRIEGAS